MGCFNSLFRFFLLSATIDASLHYLTKFLKRRKSKSLNKALKKIKTEMMILGFISLLLTISEVPTSKICVTEAVANSFLPCKYPQQSTEPNVSSATQISGLKSNTTSKGVTDESYCEAKGLVSLVSREGILQLNIFISLLAVVHVLNCVLTMCLGLAKMRRWKAWEEETQSLEYRIANDPMRFSLTRQTEFGKRHLKFRSEYFLLLWPICFLRQFYGAISKADYFTLRNGFIMAHFAEGSDFNFQKFLMRSFDEDFEKVVQFRFWIWIFSIFLIFLSAHGFHNYYWLPFVPVLIVMVVGAKLEVIITKMCLESYKENTVTRGPFLVKPNDDLFWFGRPRWLLRLIQFVLIQNSFQLAFSTWTWYEYGLKSCFNREVKDVALRISMGVVVQFLCGYVTLPLYALVTQMGSTMKKVVFTDRIVKGLKNWQSLAKRNLHAKRSSSDSPESLFNERKILHSSKEFNVSPLEVTESPSSEIAKETAQHNFTSIPVIGTSFSMSEITEERTESEIVTRGLYDGEISFASSWKEFTSGKGIRDVSSTPLEK